MTTSHFVYRVLRGATGALIASAFAATGVHGEAPSRSSIDELERRLERFRSGADDLFPIPREIVRDRDRIERELAPSEARVETPLASLAVEGLCRSRLIQASYRPPDGHERDAFSAVLRLPLAAASGQRFPVVLIQPTLAGPTDLENKGIAQALCVAGIASIVPTETKIGLPEDLPDLEAYDRLMRTEMLRARALASSIDRELRAELDSNRIGLIGFSRGAIAGALLAGLEPRIRASFLGAGGVGLARIIARSETELGREDIGKQLAAFAAKGEPMSIEDFERRLAQTLRYDGILFLDRIRPSDAKLMIVQGDQSVATASQELMYDLLCREGDCPGRAEGVAWPIGDGPLSHLLRQVSGSDVVGVHVASIVSLVFGHPEQFVDFFTERFQQH